MRESNDRLREMATRDMLTGALNARAYYEICDSLINLAKRNNAVAASQVAEQLRRSIEVLMPSFGDRQLEITASIGVARNHHSDQSMLEIQKMADQAMYRAKAAGRNRISAFEDALESH